MLGADDYQLRLFLLPRPFCMGPVDSPEILTASLRCLSEPAVWTHDSTRVRESVSLAYRL